MNIQDIEGRKIKIGQTSITVKDDAGKTRGLVNGLRKFKTLSANTQAELFHKIKKGGVWGSNIDGLLDCVLFDGKEMYYINNTRPLRFYEEYLADKEGFEGDKARYLQRTEIAEKMKEFAMVLSCEVLS